MPLSDKQHTPSSPPSPARESPAIEPTPVTVAPSIADGTERSLDPRSVTAQRLAGAISSAVLAAGLLIGAAIVVAAGSLNWLGRLIVLGAWLAATALFTAFSLWWPTLRYRYTSYRVSEQGIRIRRGVLWRSDHTIPRSRVQHTDVSQGPVDRWFELATLVIYTAGTEHAAITLGGLERGTALRIRDHLIEVGSDDAV